MRDVRSDVQDAIELFEQLCSTGRAQAYDFRIRGRGDHRAFNIERSPSPARRSFEHDMSVDAAKAHGADTRPQGSVVWPGPSLLENSRRTILCGEFRVGRLASRGRRKDSAL